MAGWDDLEEPEAPIKHDVGQQREDIARLCLRVVGGGDGKKILEWLHSVYVDVPIAVPGTDSSHAFFAEGQRNVIRDIEARINQARKI